MAVTKNDVLNAIEQLESNDQNPTNANILAITGGSNATIQKYRSEIMQERQQQAFKKPHRFERQRTIKTYQYV